MAKKKGPGLTMEQEARYQAMADWAENDMVPASTYENTLHGPDAAAHAREVLTAAGMDAAELNRLIGGRPNLDPKAPLGKHSPQLNLRVTEELKQQLHDLAKELNIPTSTLARKLLADGVQELLQQRLPGKRTA